METVAFALREEFAGEVDQVDPESGEPTTVSKFQGGVLWVGDGDFHVKDSLEAGDGTIVVEQGDSTLVELLRHYPPLKEVSAPAGATAISRYERIELDDLRDRARVRGLKGSGGLARAALERLLRSLDSALEAGDQERAQAILEGGTAADEGDGLDRLKTADLEALASENDVTLEGATNNADRIAALRAAGVRKEG